MKNTTTGHFTRVTDGGFTRLYFHDNAEGIAFVDPIEFRVRVVDGKCSHCGEDFYA